MSDNTNVTDILQKMNFDFTDQTLTISRFSHEEDEDSYNVWKITRGSTIYVLKPAKEYEAQVYETFLQCPDITQTPRIYQSLTQEGTTYLLMEYIEGTDLCTCERERLTKALDALIALQNRYWDDLTHADAACTFESALKNRQTRGQYLNDPELEAAYQKFLQYYTTVPRTLCHDDLLPFNVLVTDTRAVLIDWELAGILPYPTSLARLIAHSTEDADAFFHMTAADRDFAIQYYYDHLIAKKGIPYNEYRETLNYFLLYELCEWIMLGNRYEDADMERYHQYLQRAKELLKTL